MDRLERVKAIVKQYANKGKILLEESYANGEHASTTGYWDGYTDCAKLLLKEIDSMQEEPVSIDFEQELYKAFGQVKDFTLGMRIAKWFYDMGKNSQEPVSEELEEAAEEYSFNIPTQCEADIVWKNETEMHFKDGAKWAYESMTINSIETTVKVDAGGYPYVDLEGIELYDYDKDIPLAKEGDKVKIVVIRSEEE